MGVADSDLNTVPPTYTYTGSLYIEFDDGVYRPSDSDESTKSLGLVYIIIIVVGVVSVATFFASLWWFKGRQKTNANINVNSLQMGPTAVNPVQVMQAPQARPTQVQPPTEGLRQAQAVQVQGPVFGRVVG